MRKKSDANPLRMIVLITQLGVSMISAIFVSGALGLLVSRAVGSEVVFPFFLLLGIMAGFRNCYRIINRLIRLGEDVEVSTRESFLSETDEGVITEDSPLSETKDKSSDGELPSTDMGSNLSMETNLTMMTHRPMEIQESTESQNSIYLGTQSSTEPQNTSHLNSHSPPQGGRS